MARNPTNSGSSVVKRYDELLSRPDVKVTNTSLQYGNVFTFKMLGMNVTAFLGTDGNNFILNGKHANLNAEVRNLPLQNMH